MPQGGSALDSQEEDKVPLQRAVFFFLGEGGLEFRVFGV